MDTVKLLYACSIIISVIIKRHPIKNLSENMKKSFFIEDNEVFQINI